MRKEVWVRVRVRVRVRVEEVLYEEGGLG